MTGRTTRWMLPIALACAPVAGGIQPVEALPQTQNADEALNIMTMLTDEATMFPAMRSIWERMVQDRADLREIYARDPAFVDFIWNRLDPELKALLSRALPNARNSAAAALRKYLSPSELAAVAAVYRTETGKRIRLLSVQAMTFPAADRERLKGEEMRRIIDSMSASDRAVMTVAIPAMAKLDTAYDEVMGALGTEMRSALALEQPRLQEIATQAGRDYLAARAKRGG